MPVIDKTRNISFTCLPEQLSDFLKKIKDLTAIDSRVVMRIETDNILLFSFVGQSFKDIHAFKNYIFSTSDILTLKEKIEEPILFVSRDGKRFYRYLEGFLNYKEIINGKISVNDENYVNYIKFDNKNKENKGKETNIIGSDPITIGSQISIDDINYLMDTDKSIFNFRLDKQDFVQIKKDSLIESDPKSVLYINVVNKNLSIGETKWNIGVATVDTEDVVLSFPKSYFNTINPSDYIDIYVFENFILCKYDDFNLMILLETII